MATIQDVAKKAQVGVGTVSRVLSGKGYVKAETRERVETAIKELNYSPNQMARNLFFQKTGIVAVIVPSICHPFFSEFAESVAEELSKYDYSMMLCSTENKLHYEEKYLDMLRRSMVDGVIFAANMLDQEKYAAVNRPIVALDRELGDGIPCVSVDHVQCGKTAAEILIKSGCKNVVQFCSEEDRPDEIITPSDMRYIEFARMMKEHNIACKSIYIKGENTFTLDVFEKCVREAFEKYDGWDGVFATDALIMYAMKYARIRGLRIPEDIQFVSVDGTKTASLSDMEITSVCRPIDRLGKICVSNIMKLIQGKTEENIENLEINIKFGNTTKYRLDAWKSPLKNEKQDRP